MPNVKISRRPSKYNSKWTPEHEAILQEMFAAGARHRETAKAINARHGTRYDEYAVANHAYLMGLRRPRLRPVLVWSEAQNDELRRRVANKERYADIGDAMGIGYSTIAAQVCRLKIVRPSRDMRRSEPVMSPEERAYVRAQGQQERQLKARLNALLHTVPVEYTKPEPFEAAPDPVLDPRNITLSELGRFECHWITNDDVTAPLYCGHGIDHDKGSWCPAHRDAVKRKAPTYAPAAP